MNRYNVTYKTSAGFNAIQVVAKSARVAVVYVESQFHTQVVSVNIVK